MQQDLNLWRPYGKQIMSLLLSTSQPCMPFFKPGFYSSSSQRQKKFVTISPLFETQFQTLQCLEILFFLFLCHSFFKKGKGKETQKGFPYSLSTNSKNSLYFSKEKLKRTIFEKILRISRHYACLNSLQELEELENSKIL